MSWEPMIGLEIHAQLLTRTKLFCGCPNRFDAAPNTQVCPICLGHPGVLPSVNRRAVELAVRVGLGLGSEVRPLSVFARKNYFYPDLPKGYQITQHRRPLCEGGSLTISCNGTRHAISINRVHLEEDAGRSHHPDATCSETRIDLNRCGIPLVEIVTEPEIRSPDAASAFVRDLRKLLLWLDVCDGSMEEGSLRCDANVSLHPTGSHSRGVRTEIKNLNSLRFLRKALTHEIGRQRRILEGGGTVVQETRRYDEAGNRTLPMRGKEEMPDYRYFPEPDLLPLRVKADWIAAIVDDLPELPESRVERFARIYGLPPEPIEILTTTRALADYFEEVVAAGADPRLAASWIVNERVGDDKIHTAGPLQQAVQPASFAFLIREVASGRLSRRQAKEACALAIEGGERPERVIERRGIRQISDPRRIGNWVGEVLARHPDQVARLLCGHANLMRFFIGEVIKESGGEANPSIVSKLLDEQLEKRRSR